MPSYSFETLKVSISPEGVANVEISRPKALNAFSTQTWKEIGQCFNQFKLDGDVRCVVLSASGRLFTAGLDLKEAMQGALGNTKDETADVARKGYYHRIHLLEFQDAISAVETCDKPVIAVVHGGCIGIGIDLISACDIRIASEQAYFIVKEVDIGMAADIGTLQRLPKIVGNDSWVREACYTARTISSREALLVGLVSNVYLDKERSIRAAQELAATIASKSPVAIVSTKHLLNYSRDHTVQEGLEYTAIWNTLAHNSHDMGLAIVHYRPPSDSPAHQLAMANYTFETLSVDVSKDGVAHVQLNRPKAKNAISTQMWRDIGRCFREFKTDGDVRCVVLSGSGSMFTAGLDLKEAASNPRFNGTGDDENADVARKGYYHRLHIMDWQDCFSAVETCDKPVICAIHNGCFGAGVDLITACDIRIASEDAYFYIKEVDIGMAADVGTLQRLPKVVGNDSWVREACYTARRIPAKEAQFVGLVSSVYPNKEELLKAAFDTASAIASKSPVAIVSTKHLLNYSRDHTVQEGLEYTAIWNSLAHNSHDMGLAIVSSLKKQKAQFPKL
ncbi:ClpP/crotonase [Martensiomyces pterosporus]|nr:ClpP/crotonase [Martensiomyces pterosporus]